MVSLMYLKHAFNESEESLVQRWSDNVVWQVFSSMEYYQTKLLCDAGVEQLRQQPVLHADETPVEMLKPGKGKTHRAYLWSYCTTTFNSLKAVIFGFAPSCSGEHVRDFLGLPSSPERAG